MSIENFRDEEDVSFKKPCKMDESTFDISTKEDVNCQRNDEVELNLEDSKISLSDLGPKAIDSVIGKYIMI